MIQEEILFQSATVLILWALWILQLYCFRARCVAHLYLLHMVMVQNLCILLSAFCFIILWFLLLFYYFLACSLFGQTISTLKITLLILFVFYKLYQILMEPDEVEIVFKVVVYTFTDWEWFLKVGAVNNLWRNY